MDTVITKKSFWQSRAVQISIAPAAFLTASWLLWGERKEIRDFRNRYIPTFRHHYDDYLQYMPAVAVFGLNAAGVKGKNTLKRASVSYVFSAVTMAILVNTVKYTAKVERPDGTERNSYPSGHTANSFMNATFLHKEYGQYRSPLYSVAAYGAATVTGISRELNNRHWVSDVLAGAGIGILSTELGYVFADKLFKEKEAHKPLRQTPFPVTNKPSFLEMRIGYATALHRDITVTDEKVKAKDGFNLGLQGAWFFHKNVGIGGEFAFTSFPMNSDNFNLSDLSPELDSIADGIYTQPMGVRYLELGPFFSLPLTHNWFISANWCAGVSSGAQGNIQLLLNAEWKEFLERNDYPFYRYKPERTFSWSCGAGLAKRVSRNVAIKLYGKYFHSRHNFELDMIDDLDDKGNVVYKYLSSEIIDFSHIAIGLGLTAYLW
ncbi:hypothetical protein FPE01S_01_07080 [Flavihumibacter petaseus NBRC 106054]|uniref:Phosphatidic acid phosphatase type 2/haloperoxidase domain-containing protein n=1 Tax=Flavihumibacter petaseus NBRC 106054 TaxID=1220578 RepID=A0A0E9MVT1_9BACT|nr:hypothetical protein FPE01S_01_07080 [Flavihumibacter petaseus NBRC 106054]